MAAILVTAGPTHEYLDDVRYLANASSGRMGYAIAAAAVAAGHRAVLVSGPTGLETPAGVERIDVVSARDMAARAAAAFVDCSIAFGVAAVADHRPARRAVGKPTKEREGYQLELVPNPDVLAGLAAIARPGQFLVGFALESPEQGGFEGMVSRARAKLVRKGVHLIVLNGPAAMGAECSEVHLVPAGDAPVENLPVGAKDVIAAVLVERAVASWRELAARIPSTAEHGPVRGNEDS